MKYLKMKVKNILDEDFVNYKLPCMMIATTKCDWKCCIEAGLPITTCQNSPLTKAKTIDVSADEIFCRYISNPITKAVCFGGLEPILQFDEIVEVIKYFREHNCYDKFVIYTGYDAKEITDQIEVLRKLKNVVIKLGRYIPGHEPHYDEVLGVELASNNQRGVILC